MKKLILLFIIGLLLIGCSSSLQTSNQHLIKVINGNDTTYVTERNIKYSIPQLLK